MGQFNFSLLSIYNLFFSISKIDNEDEDSSEDEDLNVEDPTQRPVLVVLWQGISTFFVETSVHGFKYIVEEAPSALWEKLFWTITLCLSLTIAGLLLDDTN